MGLRDWGDHDTYICLLSLLWQILQTERLTKQQKFSLLRSPRSKWQLIWVLVRSVFLACKCHLLTKSSSWEGERERAFLVTLLIRALIPLDQGST